MPVTLKTSFKNCCKFLGEMFTVQKNIRTLVISRNYYSYFARSVLLQKRGNYKFVFIAFAFAKIKLKLNGGWDDCTSGCDHVGTICFYLGAGFL